MYRKQVRRRRAVLLLLVAASLTLLSLYYREGSSGGPLHGAENVVSTIFSPVSSVTNRALKPVRDLFGWAGDTFHAKGDLKDVRKDRDEAYYLRVGRFATAGGLLISVATAFICQLASGSNSAVGSLLSPLRLMTPSMPSSAGRSDPGYAKLTPSKATSPRKAAILANSSVTKPLHDLLYTWSGLKLQGAVILLLVAAAAVLAGSPAGHTRGRQISARELASYRRHVVGLVFQQFHLIPYLTAVENVMPSAPFDLA